jgi:hypothetical protein
MKFKSFLLTFMSLSLLLACGKDGSQAEQSLTIMSFQTICTNNC